MGLKGLVNSLVDKPHHDPDWQLDMRYLALTALATHALAFLLLLRSSAARKGWLY
jgi:hypothetical protein